MKRFRSKVSPVILRLGGGVVKSQLCCFFQVCLGADAEDKFHMVEVEGLTYDGKRTKVPLVVLKPSVLPSVSEHHCMTALCEVFKEPLSAV